MNYEIIDNELFQLTYVPTNNVQLYIVQFLFKKYERVIITDDTYIAKNGKVYDAKMLNFLKKYFSDVRFEQYEKIKDIIKICEENTPEYFVQNNLEQWKY